MADTNISGPSATYREQVKIHTGNIDKLKKKRSVLGWLRFISGLAIISLIYSLFFNNLLLVWFIIAVLIAAFLVLVSKDADNNSALRLKEMLLQINNEELQIAAGQYYNRDSGKEFLRGEHQYAGDIDVFGDASLFQYINRCTSQKGKRRLAKSLLKGLDIDQVRLRQEAAKVLAPEVIKRQKFRAVGIIESITEDTEKKVIAWAGSSDPLSHRLWNFAPAIHTIISLTLLAVYSLEFITLGTLSVAVLFLFLIAKFTTGKAHKAYLHLSKVEGEFETIEKQIRLVEELPGTSKLVNDLKNQLLENKAGSASIEELKGIIHRFNFRLNVFVFFFLNTFLLWDLRQLIALKNWKKRYGTAVAAWFEILADVEVLNTLSTLTFNHPHWSFPEMRVEHFHLEGVNIGHPLIAEEVRVTNSFLLDGTGKVAIVTGSNMAGKSTFLRSLAVNLVLAQIGAPVCAVSFSFSPVKLLTSMRIADNLAENTSTFYAELKKLKSIIERVNKHETVFILLDEILRGTNSLDRHTGSEALIKQLIKQDAVAVIATHDVALAELETSYPGHIANYHFDVQVEGEELYFDYKLKTGVCQSMNASILMKKIGIEI